MSKLLFVLGLTLLALPPLWLKVRRKGDEVPDEAIPVYLLVVTMVSVGALCIFASAVIAFFSDGGGAP